MNKRGFACITAMTLLMAVQGCVGTAGPAEGAGETIEVREGRLHFRDVDAFMVTLDKLGPMERKELDAWEEGIGFVSLRRLFTQAMEAEGELGDRYEELAARTGLRPEDVPVAHSPEYVELRGAKGVRVVDDPEGSYLDYDLRDVALAPLVDPDGDVVIGGVMYHFDGDSGLEQLGLASEVTIAAPASSTPGLSPQAECCTTCLPPVSGYEWSTSSGWVETGSRKRSLVTVTGSSLGSDSRYQYVTFTFDLQSQKKNFWGNWVSEFMPTTVTGSWEYSYAISAGDCNVATLHSGASSDSTLPSPLSWSGTTSHLVFQLEPHGWWIPGSSSLEFYEAFNVNAYRFRVTVNDTTFVVGPSGGACFPNGCSGQCGNVSDGCGGTIWCGSCCVPNSCQPGQCDLLPDGCGGSIYCGPCDGCWSRCSDGTCCPASGVCSDGRPCDQLQQ